MKIALFLPNWIGDAVMATPALRALRLHYASAKIFAIQRPYVADVLEGLDLVDESILWSKNKSHGYCGLGLIRRLRRESFDLAVLFPNSLRSAGMAWSGGVRRRVGFRRDGRGWLLTQPLTPHPRTVPHPVLDAYLELARAVGAPASSRQIELATTAADEQAWAAFTRQHRDLPPHPWVALNPGGAFGAAKHWPTESFGALAHRIAVEWGRNVVVMCGPAERQEAEQIVQTADHPHVVGLHTQSLSIGLSKAAVRHAELLITTDSGPRHFAPAFDVPVITLFGPTHIAWSETFYARATHLQLPVDCGPCQQRTCPLGHHKCMRDLSVDQVFAAVSDQLQHKRQRPPSNAA